MTIASMIVGLLLLLTFVLPSPRRRPSEIVVALLERAPARTAPREELVRALVKERGCSQASALIHLEELHEDGVIELRGVGARLPGNRSASWSS